MVTKHLNINRPTTWYGQKLWDIPQEEIAYRQHRLARFMETVSFPYESSLYYLPEFERIVLQYGEYDRSSHFGLTELMFDQSMDWLYAVADRIEEQYGFSLDGVRSHRDIKSGIRLKQFSCSVTKYINTSQFTGGKYRYQPGENFEAHRLRSRPLAVMVALSDYVIWHHTYYRVLDEQKQVIKSTQNCLGEAELKYRIMLYLESREAFANDTTYRHYEGKRVESIAADFNLTIEESHTVFPKKQ